MAHTRSGKVFKSWNCCWPTQTVGKWREALEGLGDVQVHRASPFEYLSERLMRVSWFLWFCECFSACLRLCARCTRGLLLVHYKNRFTWTKIVTAEKKVSFESNNYYNERRRLHLLLRRNAKPARNSAAFFLPLEPRLLRREKKVHTKQLQWKKKGFIYD